MTTVQDGGGAGKAILSPSPASELLSELLSQMSTETTTGQLQTGTTISQTSQQVTASTMVSSSAASPSASSPQSISASPSAPSYELSPSTQSSASSAAHSSASASSFPSAPLSTSSAAPQTSTSTTSTTASAILTYTSPSSTSLAPSITDHAVAIPTGPPMAAPHESLAHTPIFYISIVLGTLVVIAIICSLGAWWFKIRLAMKRKRATLEPSALSWNSEAKNSGNGDAFEAQRVAHFRDAIESNNGSSVDLSGDRDVGEPRRGSVYHLPASILQSGTAHSFSSSTVLPRVFSGAERANNFPPSASFPNISVPGASFPLNDGPYPTKRFLPRRLSTGFTVNENIRTLGPLQVANMVRGDIADWSRPPTRQGIDRTLRSEFGTPREQPAGERPRFWGVESGGLAVPWTSSQSMTIPLGTRELIPTDSYAPQNPFVSLQTGEEPVRIRTNWDDLPPLPTPGKNSSQCASYGGSDSLEEWATKLESDFTSTSKAADDGGSDSKESEALELENDSFSLQQGGSKCANDFRGREIRSTNTGSATVQKPWMSDGPASRERIVHKGVNPYDHGDSAFVGSPETSLDCERDSIRSVDLMRVATRESQTPLITRGNSKTAAARQRHSTREQPSAREEVACRESSAESTESLNGYFPRMSRPTTSKIPKFARGDTKRTATAGQSKPSFLSSPRSPSVSTGSSDLGRPGFTNSLHGKEVTPRIPAWSDGKKSSVIQAGRRHLIIR